MNASVMKPESLFTLTLAVAFTATALTGYGMDITGYSSDEHDRFSSGYPADPVPNTSDDFVGLGFDWSGVGWSSSDSRKSFAFLSPRHYLVARHFGGAPNVIIQGSNGQIHTNAQWKVEGTGQGVLLNDNPDISIGTLSNAVPMSHEMTSYAVLDLFDVNNYTGQDTLIYGHGGSDDVSTRIAPDEIYSSLLTQNGHTNILTTRENVRLEDKDSGSPIFIPWENPAGQQQLTLVGNHAATGTVNGVSANVHNFIASGPASEAIDDLMVDDGWAIRWVGNPARTWEGGGPGQPGNENNLNVDNNWDGGDPSDQYVTFDGDETGHLNVEPGGNIEIRGIYFLQAAEGNGFTFEDDGNTLTTGRGGITNYDSDNRQTFNNDMAMSAHQYWDGGEGGITVGGTIENNGYLLIVEGSGTNRFEGRVQGNGGVTVAGGVLELKGDNTYSGNTVVASGLLYIGNQEGSATGSGDVTVQREAGLGGSGSIGGSVEVLSGGRLTPGGDGTGDISIAGLTLRPGSIFTVDIFDADDFDHVSVSEGVTLEDAELDVRLLTEYTPELNEVFTILSNSGENQVTGTFSGLNQGDTFKVNDSIFRISYNDGDENNDITLTAIPEPASIMLMLITGIGIAIHRTRRLNFCS